MSSNLGSDLKFKVDENLPVEVAEALREAGYDALTVLDQSMGGALDGPLAIVCRAEARVLVNPGPRFLEHPGLPALRAPRHHRPSTLAPG